MAQAPYAILPILSVATSPSSPIMVTLHSRILPEIRLCCFIPSGAAFAQSVTAEIIYNV